jgi:hypothetical protein
MKRLIILLVLSVCCLTSYGQTKEEAKAQMKIAIQMADGYLPQSLGVMTLDKMSVQGNDLLTYITIDENQMSLDAYVSNLQASKSSVTALVVGENEELGKLLKLSGLNVVYVIRGKYSGREERLFISSYDLVNASDKETGLNDMLVQMVFQTREELPQDWGDGLTLTNVYLEDGYFCYEVLTDESVSSIQALKEIKSAGTAMEEGMLQGFASASTPMEKIFLKYIHNSKAGIRYVFWSYDSAERVSFSLTPEMLLPVLDGDYSFVE